MEIGIGITSYLRPDHIELAKSQIEKFTDTSVKLYVAYDDFEKKGIAHQKNMCLKALKDCQYIVLMDDDCIVISENWLNYFISEHKRTGQHHFNYMLEGPTTKKIDTVDGVDVYNNCSGEFMFITQEVIQKVGGFNKEYGRYGFEHCSYTKRIHMAGLTPYGEYLSLPETNKYLYALDLQNDLHYNKTLNHAPSMIADMPYIDGYIKQNRLIYEKDITQIYQPL